MLSGNIKTFIFWALFISTATTFAQNIDSLKLLVKKGGEDTLTLHRMVLLSGVIPDANEWPKYNAMAIDLGEKLVLSKDPEIKKRAKQLFSMVLNDRGLIFSEEGNSKKALECYERSIRLMEELNDQKGIANTINNIGFMYYGSGQVLTALDYFGRSLRIQEKLGDKKGLGTSLHNIGVIYNSYGNIPKAIEFYQKSLKVREDQKDQSGIANSLNAMGAIYHEQHDYQKALEYFNKSAQIQEKIGDKTGLARTILNIGITYWYLEKDELAVQYYEKGLKLGLEIGSRNAVSQAYSNFGNLYHRKREFDKALEYYYKTLAMGEETNDKREIASACMNLSGVYGAMHNSKQARIFVTRSLEIAKELGSTDKMRNAERLMAKVDSVDGNYKGAFEHYKLYIFYRDSLDNEKTRKASVKSQFQIEFDRKEREVEAEKLLMEQKNADEQKQKNIVIYSVLFGLLVVIIFSGFLFKSLSKNKKANIIITQQKAEVEQSKKEIVDSINYAKRIQYALLASDNLLKNNLPEHFVLFQPKDVVSGDFYWGTPTDDGFIYITADCTGHGVPGAFMSLLNISKLSQAISENKITRPDLILNNVRSEIAKALNPEGTVQESKDGMDAVLCKLDLKKMKLGYASAYNSFYIIRNNAVLTCKADKMPVGKGHDDSVLFTYNEIALQKGDTIYTFTDGFADQFGGPKGKKFKYKQLEEVLLSIHQQPMNKQKEILTEKFNNWKGNLEQIDDMLVIGVKIT